MEKLSPSFTFYRLLTHNRRKHDKNVKEKSPGDLFITRVELTPLKDSDEYGAVLSAALSCCSTLHLACLFLKKGNGRYLF